MAQSVSSASVGKEILVKWSVGRLLLRNASLIGLLIFFITKREEGLQIVVVGLWLLAFNLPYIINRIPGRIRKDGFVIWDRIGTRFYPWSDVDEFKIKGKVLAFIPSAQCRESIAKERTFLAKLRRLLISDRIKKYSFPAAIEYSPEELLKIIQEVKG